jgi:hypothetical protein
MVFQITPVHWPHGKRSLYCWDVLEPSPSNGRRTDLQKTSYIITILPAYWRADCCLATSNDIRNSIVACVYSVAKCLPVRCLSIHATIQHASGTFNLWRITERILSWPIVLIDFDAGDCLLGPQVLSHRLRGNNYRDFLLHDLPKLLEDVGYEVLTAVFIKSTGM